ncbi:MAG: phenylacetate--CoA ligase [Actinomycetia bacterium]|nr:phenylacetate--CoA ligase [Actinomycetes bacterium]
MGNGLYGMDTGFADRQALDEAKLAKLKTQLRRVYDQSRFHGDRFDAVGFDPGRLQTLDDLKHAPFMDKIQERASQAESQAAGITSLGMHIVCDPRDVVRISSTSGTTGTPTFTGYTAADTEVTAEIMRRSMPITGASHGDVVLHAFVMSMWIAGLPVADVLQMAGFTVVPIGGQSGPERFAVTARAVMPVQMNCTPSYARWMADTLRDDFGIDAAEFGIRRLVFSGEPGGSIPEIRDRLSELWGGADIFDGIGASHSSFFASINCQHNVGLHWLADDYVHLEVLDPTTGESLPLDDGVTGEAVYTALEKECAPAIRFRSGDRIVVRRGRCQCGRDTIRYSIEGRVDDMLLVRGVNVFPAAVQAVVNRFGDKGVGSTMRIVLNSPPPVQEPPLPVRVELVDAIDPASNAALAAEISEAVSRELRFRCAVELVPPGTLAAFQTDKNQKQQIFERAYES